jgi:hypothetical protein
VTFDQQLAFARELIARRDEIDAELTALFGGRVSAGKSSRKCKICGDSGHRSDACPTRGREAIDVDADAKA